MACETCPRAAPGPCPGESVPRLCRLHRDGDTRYLPLLLGDAAMTAIPGPPPLLQRAATFAGAVVKHVAAGLPTLDADAVAARLAVCGGCDQRTAGGVCAECGCNLKVAAMWADKQCPLGKWPG